MAAFDQGPLSKYNSLTDRHLVSYFSNDRMRHHLIRNGLITKAGEVVPDAVYRVKMARREHRRRVRDLIAQAIIHKALEMERSRQIDIRKKIEEIAKIELVRRVREDRSRMGDEDCISYFAPGNMEVSSRTGADKKRSPSDLDECKLPATPDEKSRMRLKKILPNEEIEPKHLSQLDSLTLGEYSRILQKQDMDRINKLPYLGIGKSTKKNKRNKENKLKKQKNSKENNSPDDAIQSGRSNQSKIQSLTKLSILFHSPTPNRSYDVMVEQQPSGGNTLTLYRNTLNGNSVFSVVSHRHKGFPFSLTFYINNVKDSRISTCCEYKHKVGKKIGGPNGHFSLFSVEDANPCYRCLTEQDLANERKGDQKKNTKSSDADINQQASISVDNSSESPYHSEGQIESGTSSECSSDSEDEINSLNAKQEKPNDLKPNEESNEMKNDLKNKDKFDSDDSLEIAVNDSENGGEVHQKESKLDNHNNNAVEARYKISKNQVIEVSSSSENESPTPLTNAITKVTITPKEKDKSIETDSIGDQNKKDFKINNQTSNKIDSDTKYEKEVLIEKSNDSEMNNKYGNKNSLFSEEKKDKKVVIPLNTVENPRISDVKIEKKSIDFENISINSDDESLNRNESKKFKENEERKATKVIIDNKSPEFQNNDNVEGPNIVVGLRLEDKSLNSKNKNDIKDKDESKKNLSLNKNEENDVPSSSIVIKKKESINDINIDEPNHTKSEKVESANRNLIFASPTNTSDFQQDDKSNENKIFSSHTVPEVKNESEFKSQRIDNDNLSTEENSTTTSDFKKGIDINLITPNKNDILKKPQINSDSSDTESSSSGSYSSDTDSESETGQTNENQPKTSAIENKMDLKLNLPPDDNESNKLSTSNRLDEDSLDEDSKSISNNKNKSIVPLVQQIDLKTKKGSSSNASSTEYESDSNSNSTIELENQIDEPDVPVQTKTNDTSSEDGIHVLVENDDINFKRAKEICQPFNGAQIDSIKMRNCELPNYVFNFISDKLETHSELKSIELSGCEVEISLLNLLAKGLQSWPDLQYLILADNQFTDYSLQNLINMIKFLYDNNGNSNGRKQILKLFDLSNCSIQENDLGQLIELIAKNTRVEKFILDGTRISPNMFQEICKALQKNTNMKLISLKKCEITQDMINDFTGEFGGNFKTKLAI